MCLGRSDPKFDPLGQIPLIILINAIITIQLWSNLSFKIPIIQYMIALKFLGKPWYMRHVEVGCVREALGLAYMGWISFSKYELWTEQIYLTLRIIYYCWATNCNASLLYVSAKPILFYGAFQTRRLWLFIMTKHFSRLHCIDVESRVAVTSFCAYIIHR